MDATKEIIKIKTLPNIENAYNVMWGLTLWCNYRCPYCFQKNHAPQFTPEEQIIETAKKINKWLEINNQTCITMALLGGEITYYNLPKILDEIKIRIKKINIITNFSQKIEYFKNLYSYFKSRGTWLNLMCSYHEVGDSFFEKFLELTKWCVANDHPIPIVSFVYGNDFDLTIFDRFSQLPYKTMHFNLKQLDNGEIEILKPELEEKWKNIIADKHKWHNNEILKPYLQKKKNNELWYYYPEYGYEVTYDDGEVEHVGNLKEVLMVHPTLINNEFRYCNALSTGCFIDYTNDVFLCSTNHKLLGNLDDIVNVNFKDVKNYICTVNHCPLCHEVNIYKTLKLFLEDEKIEG